MKWAGYRTEILFFPPENLITPIFQWEPDEKTIWIREEKREEKE
jgi:hypothetical protein